MVVIWINKISLMEKKMKPAHVGYQRSEVIEPSILIVIYYLLTLLIWCLIFWKINTNPQQKKCKLHVNRRNTFLVIGFHFQENSWLFAINSLGIKFLGAWGHVLLLHFMFDQNEINPKYHVSYNCNQKISSNCQISLRIS